jgi:RNA polymerase sigma-70 factor (ECF subfamily)
LKNHGDIEDIVQETFIFAYFYYEKLADKSKLKAWLCGIARNKSLKFIRDNSREYTPFEEIPDLPDLSTPESIYIEREDKENLQKIISELPEETAQTVRLRYFEGKSIEEIAQLLEIKPGTVKSRLHNARNKLELKLKGEYPMSENINSIIKESIKIAKEKISQEIAQIEQKENPNWGDYLKMQMNTEKDIKQQDMTLSEQDEIIRDGYEKSIESLLKKNDFEGISVIYDMYGDFEFSRNIGDYGLAKMLKAAEYAKKSRLFELAARYKGQAEYTEKSLEIAKYGKKIIRFRNGAITLKKSDKIIAPVSWHFGCCFGDNTDFNIFGMLFPLYDLDWNPNRNGWQDLREYKDSDFKALDEKFDANGRIYKILFSRTPETVKINGKIYEGCLHVVYRREVDSEAPDDGYLHHDRFFARFTTDSVWYAPDVGIIKVNHTTPMDEKITYYLDDYKINDEGMSNKYMPLAEGNYWSYKAIGDNVADPDIFDYLNKFTVTHADGDEAAISHLGWIYER